MRERRVIASAGAIARVAGTGLLVAAALLAAAPAPPAAAATIDTTITAGPAEGEVVHGEEATFSFTATRDGAPFPEAEFECSLDHAPFEPCESPHALEELVEGPHTFSVEAKEPFGSAVDPEAARRDFTIERGGPDRHGCEVIEDEEGNVEEIGCQGKGEAKAVGGPESSSGPGPASCPRLSAHARLLAVPAADRLRLVVRYEAEAPMETRVALRLGVGARGARLAAARHRFSGNGAFRLPASLAPGLAADVASAEGFTVSLLFPSAPRSCSRQRTIHLTVRRSVAAGVLWLPPGTVSPAPAPVPSGPATPTGGSPDGGPGGIAVPLL